MKILFFGSSDFSVQFLDSIYNSKHEVALVITGTAKPKGRGMKILPNPVMEYADKRKFKVIKADKIEDEIISRIIKVKFDCIVLVSYGKLLPPGILKLAPGKTVNVHPSLLPQYRGPSPIESAILNGDRETGISIISISEKLDEGDIYVQCKFLIRNDETRDSLEHNMVKIGSSMLISVLDLLQEDKIIPYRQGKKGMTYTTMFSREDLKVDWNKSAEEIDNRIRAFSTEPGCYSFFNEKLIKILKVSKITVLKIADDIKDKKSGEIISADKFNGLIVKCGKNEIIRIVSLKPEGKNELCALDFINGYRIKPGDFFK